MRPTHELQDRASERNSFLWVALGGISLGSQLVRLAESGHARAKPDRASGAGEEDALHAVLGLVSLSRTIMHHAEGLRTPAEPVEEGTRNDAPIPTERPSLRDLLG